MHASDGEYKSNCYTMQFDTFWQDFFLKTKCSNLTVCKDYSFPDPTPPPHSVLKIRKKVKKPEKSEKTGKKCDIGGHLTVCLTFYKKSVTGQFWNIDVLQLKRQMKIQKAPIFELLIDNNCGNIFVYVQNRLVFWRLFLCHSQVQLKIFKIINLLRYTFHIERYVCLKA